MSISGHNNHQSAGLGRPVQPGRTFGAGALGGLMLSGMFHENLPHGPGGDPQEMGPVLPVNTCSPDELLVGLMHQGGRLQRVVPSK